MNYIKKVFFAIYEELANLIIHFIIFYPDTRFGLLLRKQYFKKKFKKSGKGLNLMMGFRVSSPDKVTVGKRFSCNNFTYINCGGCNGIFFGDNVALGPNVYIRTANHNYRKKNIDVRDQGYQEKKIHFNGEDYSIIFEGNNWVGANAVILPGTYIKEGAIIGAGAIVSGVIKKNSVYVSNPPKLMFERED